MIALSSIRVRGAHGNSFDHLVGAGDKRRRNIDAEHLRGFEVDDELNFGRLHDWKVSRFLTLENPTGIDADLSRGARKARSIAY
jgi:hypothetical protein